MTDVGVASSFSSVGSPRFCSLPLARKPPLRSRRAVGARLCNHAKEYSEHRDVYTPGDDSVAVFQTSRSLFSQSRESSLAGTANTRREVRREEIRSDPHCRIFKTRTALALQRVSSSTLTRSIAALPDRDEQSANPKFASPDESERRKRRSLARKSEH